MKCCRCGSSKDVNYCEECIQDLIAKNMELQLKVSELEEEIKKEYKPKHMKED